MEYAGYRMHPGHRVHMGWNGVAADFRACGRIQGTLVSSVDPVDRRSQVVCIYNYTFHENAVVAAGQSGGLTLHVSSLANRALIWTRWAALKNVELLYQGTLSPAPPIGAVGAYGAEPVCSNDL